MRILLYLLVMVTANVVTAIFQPISIWWFIVPAGTWLVGLNFILRDWVQMKYGRGKTYGAIGIGVIVSLLLSLCFGDMLPITIAGTVAFLVSETIDTEIFTRIKTTLPKRIALSGIVGGLFDSAIFICLGLSPIGAGFLLWSAIPAAILGQWLVKSVLQLIGAGIVKVVKVEGIN